MKNVIDTQEKFAKVRNAKGGDCAVRAFASAQGFNYERAMRYLVQYGYNEKKGGINGIMLEKALQDKGYTQLENFELNQKTGETFKQIGDRTAIVIVKKHAFAVIDGEVHGNPNDGSTRKHTKAVWIAPKNRKAPKKAAKPSSKPSSEGLTPKQLANRGKKYNTKGATPRREAYQQAMQLLEAGDMVQWNMRSFQYSKNGITVVNLKNGKVVEVSIELGLKRLYNAIAAVTPHAK